MWIAGFDFHEGPEPPSSERLAAAWRPYVETCIEAFGAARCMFESNFPVDKGSYGYAAYWNACKRLAHGASAAEKADLFRRATVADFMLENFPRTRWIRLCAPCAGAVGLELKKYQPEVRARLPRSPDTGKKRKGKSGWFRHVGSGQTRKPGSHKGPW